MSLSRISFPVWTPLSACVLLLGTSGWVSAQQQNPINPNDVKGLYSPNGFTDSPQPAPAASLPQNVDINAVRGGLQAASRDARILYDRLGAQDARVPGLRQFTSDLLRLQVRTDYLANRITNRQELERNLTELREIDSNWRRLSYHLGLVSGLDRESVALIKQLDETGKRLTGLLKIGPSVDYRDLVAKTNGLVTAVERLLWDLDYTYGRSNEAQELITHGQTLKQQAAHLADGAFQQFDHDHLVTDFKLFQASWSTYLGELREMGDPLIDRDVQIVNDFERQVASLLWMEQTLDRAQLVYLVDQLRRDVDEFFGNAPLKMLMRLPESDRALATADAFYGNFENIVDVANRGENREDLQYAFSFLDEAWRDFALVYRPLQSTEAQQVLSAIEKDVTVLRDALLIQDNYDSRKASELASKVSALAGYIERDAESWLRKARVPNAAQIQRDVARYRQHAEDLHHAIAGGADVREIRQLCEEAFNDWRRVYEHIINCHTSERPSLATSSSQTTPALMELRTVFSQ